MRRHPDRGPAGPLTPVAFEVLVSLASGPRHGYALLVDIQTRTGQPQRPGSLYRVLTRLLDEGAVAEIDEPRGVDSRDERRRYYALTAAGRRLAEAEAARLAAQLDAARAAKLLPRRRP